MKEEINKMTNTLSDMGFERFWYTESQGEKRDAEILERYGSIIRQYVENPRLAANEQNEETLQLIYGNDQILMQDEELRETLRQKVLNSDEVRAFRRGNQ